MIIEKNTNKSPFFDIYKEYNTVKLTCNDGFSVILCSVGASIRQILFPTSDKILRLPSTRILLILAIHCMRVLP